MDSTSRKRDASPKQSTSRSDEENPIRSIATVRHQIVCSPTNFYRLECNTDLNDPPTNWMGSFNSYGFQPAPSQYTGYSSFRMAHLFPDCVGEVDVIGNAENIKRLLKLPYTPNCNISMMVHRIGNTLLIDDFDVHRFLLKQEDCNWQWLRRFICDNILSRLSDPDRNVPNKQTPRNESVKPSLLSKFLCHSLAKIGDSSQDPTPPASVPEESSMKINVLQACDDPMLPEPSIEENVPDPKHTKHTFNRNVEWTFEDIRMLIGTDMAIFGDTSRPCISLRLRDMHQPINVLTGIDYWLDNLMCNVPEVVMCFHMEGVVQKYEIFKTEDIPYLEGARFSPAVIRNVAQNILSFLKNNATKSGHTYWLFKGRKDDFVKLYDLTSLCTSDDFNAQPKPNETKAHDDPTNELEDQNPFTIPVAMLLYKVARNMKMADEKIGASKAGSIKSLLDNCIKLLPKEKYPQIVTSSYYLLSDLHIPVSTNPMSPTFENDTESDAQSVYEDDDSNSDDVNDVNKMNNADNVNSVDLNWEESSPGQSVLDVTKESTASNDIKNQRNPLPSPLTGDLDERCTNALHYIAHGLECLQYFSKTDEKLTKEREEIEKQTEKLRIIQEEQNPHMAQSYQAIPLPYEPLKTSQKSETRSDSDGSGNSDQTEKESLQITHPVESWNKHLKLLLLEKACLIYATLTEQAYQQEKFGIALKCIRIAIKCHHIVSKHMPPKKSNYQANILARAGDCFFQLSQNFDKINQYSSEYEIERDVDLAIQKELQKDLNRLGDYFGLQQLSDNVEQLILQCIGCYEAALESVDSTEVDMRKDLTARLGSVLNELGVKYMHWSQEHLPESHMLVTTDEPRPPIKLDASGKPIYKMLAQQSHECFVRGIDLFKGIEDDANLVILLCNMGRFMRFRAHLDDDATFHLRKVCYLNAFKSYERALTILESKQRNVELWDLVIWELSTGKFTLARNMMAEFDDVMTEEIEQEIIGYLLSALKLCEGEESSGQMRYSLRMGLIYQQLGNVYRDAFRSQRLTRRKAIQLCELYYKKGCCVLEAIDSPAEALAIHVDRLVYSNLLVERSKTLSQKARSILEATLIAFTPLNLLTQTENIDESDTQTMLKSLAKFEEQLLYCLKQLVRTTLDRRSDVVYIERYKQVYRYALQSTVDKNNMKAFAEHMKELLLKINDAVDLGRKSAEKSTNENAS